jgi:hypothetical protein
MIDQLGWNRASLYRLSPQRCMGESLLFYLERTQEHVETLPGNVKGEKQ